jgi:L-ribulose-5-phosphate 3-epimerase
MLKSISVWALAGNAQRSADSLFAEAREHGFDGIELAIGHTGLVTPGGTAEDCARLVEVAAEHRLQVASLASGLGWEFSMSADDPDVRRRGVDAVRSALRAAAWLNVRPVLVVPGMVSPGWGEEAGHVRYDVAVDRMRAGIRELVPTAEELEVVIAVENVWNRVLLSPLEMRDFIDAFDSQAVGAYLDVGNMIPWGYAEDWVRILGRRVCAVHFKDYRRATGGLDGFCELLEGDVDFPAVMAALRDVGYEGPCTAEFFELDSAALSRLSAAMDRILSM